MSEGKRYYWLKLYDNFFDSKRIKKLRKLAGGDTYTIIYLKMQLKAIKTEGILRWTGLEDDFASELALDLDEEPDNVAMTLQYLVATGLAETNDNMDVFLPYAVENTGSEGASAQRVREFRARQMLQSNADVTVVKQLSNGEIEKEKKKDTREREKKFVPPTLEEVKAYVKERNSNVDPNKFFEYYETGKWVDGKGNPVRNWKQKLLTWEKKDGTQNRNAPVSNDPKRYEAGFQKAIADLKNGQ